MTLQELVYSLKKAMLANPLVHTWIDDFNFTSAYHDIKYGAAALDIGLFNVDRKGFMTVNVNLYCFDRMYDEPSDSKMVRTENNSLPLYSKCMMVVQNAIKTMDTRIGIVDATYQPFRHKYTDDCAGVLCQLTLTAPFTICYDDFYEPIPIPDVTLNAIISHGSVAATVNDVPVQLPYTAPRGTQVQLLVNPDDGYAFVEWSDHNTQNPRQVTMTTDLTLACECVQPQFTLTFTASTGGSVYPTSFTGIPGQTVVVTATPQEHWSFSQWDDGDTTNPRTFTIGTQSETYDAAFRADLKYLLTFDHELCTTDVTSFSGYTGERVTVTATPNYDCHWVKWDDNIITNPRVFTVGTDSERFTAISEYNDHTLTFLGENGTCSPSTFVGHYYQDVTVHVNPAAGYRFDHWEDGNTENPRQFRVNHEDEVHTATCVETTTFNLSYHIVAGAEHINNVTARVNGVVTPLPAQVEVGAAVIMNADVDEGWYAYYLTQAEDIVLSPFNPFAFEMPNQSVDFGVTTMELGGELTVDVNDSSLGYAYASYVFTAPTALSVAYSTGTFAVANVNMDVNFVAVPNSGVNFVQWSDGSAENPYIYDDFNPMEVHEMIATLEEPIVTRTLTFSAAEYGSVRGWVDGVEVTSPALVTAGQSIRLVATPDEECHFVNWSDGTTTSTYEFTMPDNDVTLEAFFAVNVYLLYLTYDAPEGMPVPTMSGGGTMPAGTERVVSTSAAETGYVFQGWYEESTLISSELSFTYTMPAHAVDLVAHYRALGTYTITASCAHGTITGAGTYAEGATCTLTCTPDQHWNFDRWTEDGVEVSTSSTYSFVVNSDRTLVAEVHEDTKYVLTFSAVNGSVDKTSFIGYYGEEVVVEASTNLAHYHWVGWNDGNIENPRTFVASADADYVARFEEDEKFTLQFNGNFCSCSPSSFTGYLNDTVEVDVVDITEHYHWGSWNDGSTAKPRTFTVEGSAIYTATCEIDQHTITTAVTPAGSGSVTGGGTYNWGASVTLTATANGGYQFVKWSDDVTTSTRTITVTGDATYTAEFELIPVPTYTLTFDATEGGAAFATVNGVEVLSPATVHEGDAVVLTAVGELGYIFDGFEDEEGIIIVDTPYEFSMPAQDKTFVARFSPEIVGGYLTFTPVTTEESDPDAPAQATIYLENNGTNNPQCKWSYDGELWQPVPTTSTSALTFQQPIYLKGVNASGFSTSSSNYSIIHLTGLSGSKVEASGSVMSLIDGVGESTAIPGSGFCFTYLFKGCISLLTPPSLPATTLTITCYSQMFHGCTSLTSVPYLPAETLTTRCYSQMFQGCTSLTAAPALPATTLAEYCYSSMFSGCTSLVNPPSLPATTLAISCYGSMFYGCTSLTSAPSLPATTLAISCYGSMFSGCTSLTSAPALPATTLANYCYGSMFSGCTSLTSAPSLPATTLAQYCYQGMFSDCTSLTSAPALPATTLTQGCYYSMFYGCTSLVNPPVLPAETIVNYCYYQMFYYCVKLTGPVSILASNNPATLNITGMFTNTGTARPSTPTDYNKIYVGGNVALWNSITAGIDSTYWTVQLITEDADDQLPDEPQSE